MFVALRKQEKGTCVDQLRGTYHYRHAQIVISVACGKTKCAFCRAGKSVHTLTFTAEREKSVAQLVDCRFRTAKWTLWQVPCAPALLREIYAWLRQQVGKPFYATAECVNGTCAPWLCCLPPAVRGCIALGVRDGRDANPSQWFCIELCISALHRAGYFLTESACGTAPDRLADLLDDTEGIDQCDAT